VRPKRPPKKKGDCPKGGDHVPKVGGKKKGSKIEHTCAKCGFSWLRALDPERSIT
jgi:hypothetical protein